jgi:predicted transposase/invertase (TIGR01784 family)
MAMKKNKSKTDSYPELAGQAKYIDPHTDFGFKKLFGTESNKDVLRDFLQALLQSKGKIATLRYLNTEQRGISRQDCDAVFDIYCESSTGEKFIVEMQKAEQNYFKDRSVFYSTFPIQSQAKKGKWDFKLNSVYTVGVLNFVFEEDRKEKKQYQYIHHVQLSDIETREVFYDKLTFVYLELPKFNKQENELETLLDKWMYVLKNLALLDDRPKALRERVFARLFRIAEIEQLSAAERIAYRESQKHYWDLNNVIDTANQKAVARETKLLRDALSETAQALEKERAEKEEIVHALERERAGREKQAQYIAEPEQRFRKP